MLAKLLFRQQNLRHRGVPLLHCYFLTHNYWPLLQPMISTKPFVVATLPTYQGEKNKFATGEGLQPSASVHNIVLVAVITGRWGNTLKIRTQEELSIILIIWEW